MKKILYKSIILIIPFVVLMIIFVGFDPMKIFKNYQSPVTKGVLMNDRLFAIKYLKKTNHNYDSFIFGSSRSKAFKTKKWGQHINSNKIYHIGVNDETLYGINGKIVFLNSNKYKIKNALIILDNRILSLTNNHTEHIFCEPTEITNETKIEFHKKFLLAFLNPSFLTELFNYKLSGKIKEKSLKLWNPGFSFNYDSGDIFYSKMDSLIKKDSTNYYQKNKNTFYNRKYIETYKAEQTIKEKQKEFLIKIKQIFTNHNTNYKIIITPNYDQKHIHQNDLFTLQNIFGKENVVDFSGINNITNNIGNYYEEKHFKPFVADSIMKITYNKDIYK